MKHTLFAINKLKALYFSKTYKITDDVQFFDEKARKYTFYEKTTA